MELQIFCHSLSSVESKYNSVEAQAAVARVEPSRRVKMFVRMMSGWRVEVDVAGRG